MKLTMKLTILGSMGWIPVRDQHTCCYCLEYGDTLIIFDAGTGMARFSESWARDILASYEKILILLSHYHLDHTLGLMYLTHSFKDKEIHIAGPGPSVYGRGVRDILSTLIAPPLFGRSITEFPMEIRFHDLGAGTTRIEGIQVDAILQEHSDPSLGIKIEDHVCYITDTPCREATVEFARDCKLLLHETWFDSYDYEELLRAAKESGTHPAVLKDLKSHSPVKLVADIAVRAAPAELVLIHLNPGYEENRLLAMEREAQDIFPRAHLARDGQVFEL